MSCLVAFHYRSYGTFFLQQNRLHKIHRGFTHYKYYRAQFFGIERQVKLEVLVKDYQPKPKPQNKKTVSRVK